MHNFFIYFIKNMTNMKIKNPKIITVTSRLFTHIVSTEKVRKDMRDRKDTRGTNILTIMAVF